MSGLGPEGTTEAVAAFVAHTASSSIPAAARRGATTVVLDTLGVAVAGRDDDVSAIARNHAAGLAGGPEATIVGSGGTKVATPHAALANGAQFNVLDFDGFWHLPTHVLPAALAVGEAVHASGREVLDAFILASEVGARVREALEARRDGLGGPTFRGWYHVTVYGPLTAALAAGRLLGLDVLQLRSALGIAAGSSGGYRRSLGTAAKAFLSGGAARAGVEAAILARDGVTAHPSILEARVGLVSAVCLPGESDWTPVLRDLGSPYELAGDPDLKPYPAVGPTQLVIGGLRRLVSEHGLAADHVRGVHARVACLSAEPTYPTDPHGAGFSWPYVIAATLADGTFEPAHLSARKISDARIRALAAAVEIESGAHPDRPEIAVELTDGRQLRMPVDGAAGVLADHDGAREKFARCAEPSLGRAAAGRVRDLVEGIDDLADVGTLMAAL